MTDPENFLARWSRRKHAIEGDQNAPEQSAMDDQPQVKVATAPPETAVDQKHVPEFDVSSLPAIESIEHGTDIRSFLQKGVPLELTRAALRRAWITDPAIRDFIGIAENQWDFATGSDIPGFGPLEASDDVRGMVAELFQKPGRPSPVDSPKPQIEKDAQASLDEASSELVNQAAATPEQMETPVCAEQTANPAPDDGAVQQKRTAELGALGKRTHGRALPR